MWVVVLAILYGCVVALLRRARTIQPRAPRRAGVRAAHTFPKHVAMRGFAGAAFQEDGGYASDALVGGNIVHMPGVETDWSWRAADGQPPPWADGLKPVHFSKGNGKRAHFDDDLRRMRHAGANTYRFSICWAKLQRAPRAPLDARELARVSDDMRRMQAHGLTPMPTIVHFVLPRWLGGWHDPHALDLFADFARRVAAQIPAFGEEEYWITINEPNIATVHSYVIGTRPPGVRDLRVALRAYITMLRAHVVAARALRARKCVIHASFAWNVSVFSPRRPYWLVDEGIATALDGIFNSSALCLLTRGGAWVAGTWIAGEAVVPQPAFIAINCYTRLTVGWPTLDIVDHEKQDDAALPNDLRWDLSSHHFASVLHSIHAQCPSAVIVVTEHGVPDASDANRCRLLCETSRVLATAPYVKGYLHWCFTDNHEWELTPSGVFGVVSVDYARGCRRVPRPSFGVLRKLWA